MAKFLEGVGPRAWAVRLLTVEQILGWADAFHAAHGRWPIAAPVPVAGAPGETWKRIDRALREGDRGLPMGTSLARLLAEHCSTPVPIGPARLRVDRILAWADAYHAANGQWPIAAPVLVADAPGESWDRIDHALRRGERGLPGGSSLASLLAGRRGTPNPRALPSVDRILAWADAHHAAHGQWPIAAPVPVADVPGESWDRIDHALRRGARTLSAGSSLARLLAERRGARPTTLRRLRIGRILAWADAYHTANGQWPIAAPVPVADAPGESWDRIDRALRRGERGLTGGTSLTRLLSERRGAPKPRGGAPLSGS